MKIKFFCKWIYCTFHWIFGSCRSSFSDTQVTSWPEAGNYHTSVHMHPNFSVCHGCVTTTAWQADQTLVKFKATYTMLVGLSSTVQQMSSKIVCCIGKHHIHKCMYAVVTMCAHQKLWLFYMKVLVHENDSLAL
jgi:hypothetical protein